MELILKHLHIFASYIVVTIFTAAGKTRYSLIECAFLVFGIKYETWKEVAKNVCETVENIYKLFFLNL